MSTRKRMITEKEQRILDRVAKRELKAREAAARREKALRDSGYRTLTVTVPGEIYDQLSRHIKEITRQWIAANRAAKTVPPEDVDPLERALQAMTANLDFKSFGPVVRKHPEDPEAVA